MLYRIVGLTCFIPFLIGSSKPIQGTPKLMQETLTSIQVVLPLSLKDDAFRSRENKKVISEHLNSLAQNAQKIFSHFQTQNDDRSFVASSLANDARDAKKLFEGGNYDSARFTLHHISENCVSCHSKLPARSQKNKVHGLFDSLKKSSVSGLDLAHFLVMTRQFEEACKVYEQEFVKKPKLLLSKSFGRYLKVRIRVLQDIDSVAKLIKDIRQKKLVGKINQSVKTWEKAVTTIQREKYIQKISISSAEKLMALGDKAQDYPQDHAGIVYYISASAITEMLISSKKTPTEQRAEAYYLAGRVESALSHSIWINELEHYYELAIKTAPKSKWAKLALKKLEDEYLIGYSGSSGTHLPDDVKSNLERLKQLVN